MLYSYLNKLESLHANEAAVVDENVQKTLGFPSISVSQLSRGKQRSESIHSNKSDYKSSRPIEYTVPATENKSSFEIL